MSKEIELKPCPTCGAKVEFFEGDENHYGAIVCVGCGSIVMAENLDSDEELIEHWNKRPSPWISVDKETPKLGEIVFIVIGDLPEYDIGVLTDSGWITMNHSLSSSKDIKYFMRKPELPKE
jgi:DNA-directed RNA polymerase subunit RPC12/RpoP